MHTIWHLYIIHVITKVVNDATSKPTEMGLSTVNMIQNVENVFKQVERERERDEHHFELLLC